jgi:hypothetical protein
VNVLRSIRLKFCTIECHQDVVYTRFPDGTYAPATAHQTDDYREVTRRLGYGDDVMAYCREHEVLHSFTAEWLFDKPSAVLWAIAHDRMLSGHDSVYEEVFAQTAQRWIRAGERPIVSGVNWFGFRQRALELLDGLDR